MYICIHVQHHRRSAKPCPWTLRMEHDTQFVVRRRGVPGVDKATNPTRHRPSEAASCSTTSPQRPLLWMVITASNSKSIGKSRCCRLGEFSQDGPGQQHTDACIYLSLYISIYIYIYICMYTHIYIYIYINICIFMYTYFCTHAEIHM